MDDKKQKIYELIEDITYSRIDEDRKIYPWITLTMLSYILPYIENTIVSRLSELSRIDRKIVFNKKKKICRLSRHVDFKLVDNYFIFQKG